MRMKRKTGRILAVLAALLLAAVPAACAEENGGAALTDMQLELGNSSIVYPALTGMADETLQKEINRVLSVTK